jgi:hypothetical protein
MFPLLERGERPGAAAYSEIRLLPCSISGLEQRGCDDPRRFDSVRKHSSWNLGEEEMNKNRQISCRSCLHLYSCPERSRAYPCAMYQRGAEEDENYRSEKKKKKNHKRNG